MVRIVFKQILSICQKLAACVKKYNSKFVLENEIQHHYVKLKAFFVEFIFPSKYILRLIFIILYSSLIVLVYLVLLFPFYMFRLFNKKISYILSVVNKLIIFLIKMYIMNFVI